MKSYSDLEQSKKLAEILPLESADMVLLHEEPYETSDSKFDGLHQALCVPFSKYDKSWRQKYKNISYFPCWSLAALLEQLPYEVCDDDGHSSYLEINKEDDLYQLVYTDPYCDFESIETDRYEYFVDACYEMILKLHEINIL